MAYEIVNMWLSPSKYGTKSPRTRVPQGMVVHNTSNSAEAKAEANYMINNNNNISYNVVVDDNFVVQCVPFNRVTHHAGNYNANQIYIGLEIALSKLYNGRYEKAEDNALTYIAHVFIQYNWDVSRLRFHREFFNTACPERVVASQQQAFRQRLANRILSIKKGEVAKPKPVEEVKPKEEEVNMIKYDKTTRNAIIELCNEAYNAGIFSKKPELNDKSSDELLANRLTTVQTRMLTQQLKTAK